MMWLVRLSFILPVLWWVYLFFTTQMVVVFDSVGYEELGRIIQGQGWWAFLSAEQYQQQYEHF